MKKMILGLSLAALLASPAFASGNNHKPVANKPATQQCTKNTRNSKNRQCQQKAQPKPQQQAPKQSEPKPIQNEPKAQHAQQGQPQPQPEKH